MIQNNKNDNYLGRWVTGDPDDPLVNVGRFGDHDIEGIASYYSEAMDLRLDDTLLDVCCGNGLITREFAKTARQIDAIDFSQELVKQAKASFQVENINFKIGDAFQLDRARNGQKYNKISMIAAFQHFDKRDALELFSQLKAAARPDGTIFISDILDKDRKLAHRKHAMLRLVGLKRDKKWPSFGSRLDYVKRQLSHFTSKTEADDRLGWWWRRAELVEQAASAGLSCRCLDQPRINPHHFYRFDALLKPAQP